mmetsp:Transcript_18043/g.38801  ORF Transcript_18043/g.38801 Transcript_18043/m.38801 type:complete len:239 (+) Transcript_18043:4025-4741(+)
MSFCSFSICVSAAETLFCADLRDSSAAAACFLALDSSLRPSSRMNCTALAVRVMPPGSGASALDLVVLFSVEVMVLLAVNRLPPLPVAVSAVVTVVVVVDVRVPVPPRVVVPACDPPSAMAVALIRSTSAFSLANASASSSFASLDASAASCAAYAPCMVMLATRAVTSAAAASSTAANSGGTPWPAVSRLPGPEPAIVARMAASASRRALSFASQASRVLALRPVLLPCSATLITIS